MARILDKAQDTQAVVRLIDQLHKTILIYQVCAKSCQVWAVLTPVTTGVPTAIDPQPGRTVDGKSLRIIFALGLTCFPVDSSLLLTCF